MNRDSFLKCIHDIHEWNILYGEADQITLQVEYFAWGIFNMADASENANGREDAPVHIWLMEFQA